MALLLVLIDLPDIAIFNAAGSAHAALALTMLMCGFSLTPFFAAKGMTTLARLWPLLIGDAGIFYFADFFGPEAGMHFVFAPAMAAPYFLFSPSPRRELRCLVFLILWPALLFLLTVAGDFNLFHAGRAASGLPPEMMRVIWYLMLGNSLVLLGGFVGVGVLQINSAWRRREVDYRIADAVAQTTQMLAHDVRKPFSLLRVGMSLLADAKDPEEVRRILGRLLPAVDKAVTGVDGLISDVMEMGSPAAAMERQPVSPESLIEASLGEIFRVHPGANVSVAYGFRHRRMVSVHALKIGRVFSNIVQNAMQAMGHRGNLWFKTKEGAGGSVVFCIGNGGSFIPAADLPTLFDAFFTKGKPGGTGLGLAIAQKVIRAHGGKIWCESSRTSQYPNGQVEFFFTLPAEPKSISRTTARLPAHSSEISGAMSSGLRSSQSGRPDGSAGGLELDGRQNAPESAGRGELTLEEDIGQAWARAGRALRILLVDDEAIYRVGLASFLKAVPGGGKFLTTMQARDGQSALALVAARGADLVITDVDLGPGSIGGFELVAEIRKTNKDALICVHSNRTIAADLRAASEAGADVFLPKPMARAQLLRLILQSFQRTHQGSSPGKVAQSDTSGATLETVGRRPKILIVDDDVFVLEAWEAALKSDATLVLLESFDELSRLIGRDPYFVDGLTCAVTDMYLDGSSGGSLEVGRELKRLKPSLPVFLSSDGNFPGDKLAGTIDLVIAKEPTGLSVLLGFCEAVREKAGGGGSGS